MQYGAITLDTSIFDRNGLNLHSGLLKTLEQFKGKPTQLILSEIVIKELHNHLKDKSKQTKAQVNKSFKDSNAYLMTGQDALDQAKSLVIPDIDDDAISKQSLKSFIDKTGAEIVTATDNVEIKEILEMYFNAAPPFSNAGKKKSEFPDAIALKTLEAWAVNNDTKILAVSADDDWLSFSESSKYIDVTKDLADAISQFEPDEGAIQFCQNLLEGIEAGELPEIYDQLSNYLCDETSSLYSEAEAESFFHVESDLVELEFVDFEFIEPAIFKPIEAQNESIAINTSITIHANAHCAFTFWVKDSIDKDYVTMGKAYISTETDFDTDILLTIIGDYKASMERLEIDSLEILEEIVRVDFGEIEPDGWRE